MKKMDKSDFTGLIHLPVDMETQHWYNMIHGIEQKNIPTICCIGGRGGESKAEDIEIATSLKDVTCSHCLELLEDDCWCWDWEEMEAILNNRFHEVMSDFMETEEPPDTSCLEDFSLF